MDFSTPKVMGILNLAPDSFYDGGKYTQHEDIISRVKQIVDEGADIIDVGAFSSRPGASPISINEEMKRLVPALEIIRSTYPDIILSADTYRTEIARRIISDYQVDIINDITAGEGDPDMFDFIAGSKIPYVMMHMQGTPENMQNKPVYEDVVDEVLSFLQEKAFLLKTLGVNDIIIDPGFGFGKSLDHNFSLMAALEVFTVLELPLLVGVSRKSMIYKFLGSGPESALNGTTALHMYALTRGTNILRVHDVREAVETRKLYEKLAEEERKG